MQNTQTNQDYDQDDFTATYSPEDNKLRLYAVYRLDEELYKRVRAAGFIWAPKQELFVAPSWTPQRHDLLLELAGFIDDEQTTLAERAEIRAERFGGYKSNRLKDAENSYNQAKAIADNIPFGQPILIGHHSEKKARKDAEKIERAGRHAVDMWKTAEYWEYRAKGVLRNANYKDRPDVRARRIKTLEAENRKYKSYYTPRPGIKPTMQKDWTHPNYPDCPEVLCVYCGAARGGSWVKESRLEGIKKHYSRWIEHNEHRIAYERAILEAQGGLSLLDPPKRPKPLPMLNYKAPEGIRIENRWNRGKFDIYPQYELTKAEYSKIPSDYKGTNKVNGDHRVRVAMNAFIPGLKGHGYSCVFLTDSKKHEKPEGVQP